MKFEINEATLKKAVAPTMKKIADEKTRQMDQLAADYGGRHIDDIREALVVLFERDRGSITEPELTQYAELIHQGQRIVFRADGA